MGAADEAGPAEVRRRSLSEHRGDVPPVLKVEPLVTARAVRGPFDYLHPEGEIGIEVGTLLEVPFGHQRVQAIVTGFADESEHELVAPLRVGEPVLPADLVALAAWTAAEYASTTARALGLMLPPRGVKPKSILWAERTGDGEAALAPGSGERLTDCQRAALAALPGRTGDQLATLRRLERRGFVTITARAERRVPSHGAIAEANPTPELTGDQRQVLVEIEAAAPADQLLLHGVTGSGKTEVYLRAAAQALARGEGVLILVPEIALTPQMLGRVASRFGDTVAVLHSGMPDGERYDEWQRLRSGEARVCVGPRSAVFAPIDRLGLIVVDEEHDSSYKHEGDPRYDARSVAAERARMHGAVLICGSATPRPESVQRLRTLRLPQRVDGAGLPPVELIDLKETSAPIHPRTHEALVDSRKAIVLLNRRGWSNFLTCRGCGQVWECPNCDVALIYHRAEGRLACHHCGHSRSAPQRCEECGSVSIARHGAGTERLEAELVRLGRLVVRLDAGVGDPAEALRRFGAEPRAVLLGTQVVAKGHDFPDVDLAVVVDADSTLRFPDFRSQERTFSLITQLAGRAGRGASERSGSTSRVIVQTIDPDDETVRLAAAHDSDGFLRAELRRRQALRYPPFSTLIRILLTAPEAVDADAAAAVVAAGVPGALGPAPLFRVRGRERRQLVVKAAAEGHDRRRAIAQIAAAVEGASARWRRRDVRFVVDVDPQ